MCDVDRRRIELLNDIADRGQHLDLRRHVQRGRWFVEDNQVGAAGHRHRRHRPLQLTARNLMRIAKADLLRVGQAQAPVQLNRVRSLSLRALTPC